MDKTDELDEAVARFRRLVALMHEELEYYEKREQTGHQWMTDLSGHGKYVDNAFNEVLRKLEDIRYSVGYRRAYSKEWHGIKQNMVMPYPTEEMK